MSTGNIAAFLAVSMVVIVTPGPDTALTIRNTLFGGRRGGVATALGVAGGQATWALFTAAGVAALLSESQPALAAIRLAGAAYLLILGALALLHALRRRSTAEVSAVATGAGVSAAAAFGQGLASNLANPKMVVFFVSLLPQFTGSHASFPSVLALGLVFCALTLGWLTAYAAVIDRVGAWLHRSAVRRAFDALTGAVLVALGLRVLLSQPR